MATEIISDIKLFASTIKIENFLKDKTNDFIILLNKEKKQLAQKGIKYDYQQLVYQDEISVKKETLNKDEYFIITFPIEAKNSRNILGYITYGHSAYKINKVIGSINGYIFYASLAILLIAFLILSFVVKRITKPIKIIKKGLEMVSLGKMSYRINIESSDEYGFLAAQFNNMVEQLGNMMEELELSRKDLENQVFRRTKALNLTNDKLKKAMEELKYTQKKIIQTETQKSLTSIVSGFAHEINNPLTGILGYIDLMELNNDLSVYSSRRLESIKDQALRIKEIIDDLNQLDPEIEQTKMEIDLTNLLEKLIKIISKENEANGIIFKTNFSNGNTLVFGNHFALWQIFEGIIENSIEAIKERKVKNGRINVNLKQSKDHKYTIAEISDNGGGFENLENAFNPFYTTKNRTQKRGIGLSIAYNIIQEHKGNILIRNQEDSLGTRGALVSINLPFYIKDQSNSNIHINVVSNHNNH